MVRRSSRNAVAITPAACMKRKRDALYAADFVQCKLQVPASFNERLKHLKRIHKMRGLDSVVSALIRKAMASYSLDELIVPPPPPDYDKLRKIALHIPREHYDFLRAVAHRNRGINLGVALETMGSYVEDLSPSPVQLSLANLWGDGKRSLTTRRD